MAITNTPEAEGAQALFCYIADVLGSKQTIKEFKPYLSKVKGATEFFDSYKEIVTKAYSSGAVKTEKSKDTIVKFIEKNQDWFISSLKISQYIIEEVDDISGKFQKIKKENFLLKIINFQNSFKLKIKLKIPYRFKTDNCTIYLEAVFLRISVATL